MRDWSIAWRSAKIYGTQAELRVYDISWLVYGTCRFVEWFDSTILRHRWCDPPNWTFAIGWAADEDGFKQRSLGGFLFSSFCAVANMEFRRRKNEMTVDLTDKWLDDNDQHWPLNDD